MAKLPILSGNELVKVLEMAGFQVVRQKGSHVSFQNGAILDLIKGGVTTVYVSHSMEAVKKTCDRAIWLEQGEIRAEGEAGQVVEEYLSSLSGYQG